MNKNENRGILHQVIDAMKHDLNDDGSPKYPEEFLEGMCMDLLLGGKYRAGDENGWGHVERIQRSISLHVV